MNYANTLFESQSALGNATVLRIYFSPLHASDEGVYTCQSNLTYPVSSVVTKIQAVAIQSK